MAVITQISELRGYDWIHAFEVAGPHAFLDREEEAEAYGRYNDPDIRRAHPTTGDPDVSLAEFTRYDIAEVVAAEEGDNDGPSWLCFGRLKDGRWFILRAGCDYTGWDCQSGGDVDVASTRELILQYGMDDEELKRLGQKRPA